MSYLILVRHGESEWNKKGLWTGITDIPLSKKGGKESKIAAKQIQDIPVSVAFTSTLKRAQQTLGSIISFLNVSIPVYKNSALNERDYGEFTGKNKWEIKKEVGDEEFLKIRRGWDTPIKGGESLQDVYNRVIPYYKESIAPLLEKGENVLVVAHGNSIRALVKYLENIPDNDIAKIELKTGEVYLYKIDTEKGVLSKEVRSISL